MTRQRKPTREEALARVVECEADLHASRMVATYALNGTAPDYTATTHGVEIRAWGLRRQDGGFVALHVVGEASWILRSALTWCDDWRRFAVSGAFDDIALRGIAMRDEIVPAILSLQSSIGAEKSP